MARFVTSPSRIARYFFHQCDRQLRYFATPKARRAEEGVPNPPWDQSPVTRAILESGYAWEAEVVGRHLAGRVVVAKGSGKVFERQHDVPETLRHLASAKQGTFIYQPTFQTPRGLYEEFGIDRDLVEFSESRPDLIEVVPGKGGRRTLRVHDLKASDALKLTHRIQVALYSLQLAAIVKEQGIDADVDLETGGIWLVDRPRPDPFELGMTRPHVERFLGSDLGRILSTPAAETRGHLCFRCEWCEYFEDCYQRAERTQDVSLLPYLSTSARRFLADEGVDTLPQLRTLLGRKDADVVLARCASLEGRRPRLTEQVRALESGKVFPHGGRSLSLPIGENVKVLLTAQSDPVTGEPYLFGLLVRARKELLAGPLAGCGEPEVFIASNRASAAANRARFVARLHEVYEAVHGYNEDEPEWPDKLTLQTFVYDSFEREILIEALFEEMKGPKLAQEALQLLLHFVDPGLAVADEHSDPEAGFPIVILTEAIRDLLALPVPVGFRLQEALAELSVPGKKPFEYRALDYYHFPLSTRLRADAVFALWNGDGKKLAGLQQETRMRLYATSSLLEALRARAAGLLVAWPPKFRFPEPWNIKDPLPSRLAFLERFESISSCNAVRAARAQGPEERLLRGNALLLKATGANKLRVLQGDMEVEPGPFLNWLLAENSADGERDLLSYADYRTRAGYRWGKVRDHAAPVFVTDVSGDVLTVELYKDGFDGTLARGAQYVMTPRFIDGNADRVVKHLESLDARGFFRQLLEAPPKVLGKLSLADPIARAARRQVEAAGLTASQERAFQRLCEYRGTLVWGPPGTGKTHFIASAVLALAQAHAKAGRRFHVAVSAFTHAAIENVLRKAAELGAGDASVAKLEGWRGISGLPTTVADWAAKSAGHMLGNAEQAIVGGTIFALNKLEEPAFDLVVLDEASQMRCPHSAIPASILAPGGRLLIAGDDMQLPPVIQGDYPEPEDGSPPLHRSIFEVLRLKEAPVEQLLENFRMNDVLTRFASESIYGPGYRCASDAVARRRLPWTSKRRDEDGFEKYCLDPDYPLVLAVLEGVFASRANPEEAALVARLVASLRAGLRAENGKGFPATEAGDRAFFREGVFIVSPHHAQIRELHRALAEERDWLSEPFVDTVDKMQGQEAAAVIASYGVSDADFALDEGEFIYSRNRLNVSITRAQSKCVVFLPRPLLDAAPAVMDDPVASEGLRYMRALEGYCRKGGEERVFAFGDDVSVRVRRVGTP